MNTITPEHAIKRAEELVAEGNFEEGLEELHNALHNRRLKGNNLMLEKIMVSHL
jgi:hypothetical protein